MPTLTALVSPAVGIDLSTHAVHMALVGRDAVIASAIVELDGLVLAEQFRRATWELGLFRKHEPKPSLVLIESPFYGRENPDTAIRLGIMVGFMQAAAVKCGYDVRLMKASEWRPLAGIGGLNSRAKRAEMKRDALRMVRIEYGLDTRDDNLAEAILMGRVAVGLARREALI